MPHSMVNSQPIFELCRSLSAEFARDSAGPRAAQILVAYASAHDDWRRFAISDLDHYTRNLVFRNAQFEMLVLCWSAGQRSPIHNHAGQHCWMAVLDGEMEETLFRAPSSDAPLAAGRSVRLASRGVAYIDDGIALHRVAPVGEGGGVSLHVYSRPIDACNVYDEATGQIARRQLAYDSIDGRRVEPASNDGPSA